MGLGTRFRAWLEGLRFPMLLLLAAGLFVIDLLVPDAIPFVDEALLALVTIVLARLRRRRPGTEDSDGPGTSSE